MMTGMSTEEIFSTVRDLIADQFNMEPKEITEDCSFTDDLGADSVDLIELIMAIEEAFDMEEIPEEELQKIKTVGDCVEYLSNLADR